MPGSGGADGTLSSSVREGKSLLESGQLDAALAELQKSPDDPDSLYYQGRVWAKKAESAPLPTPPPPPCPRRGMAAAAGAEFKPEEIQAAQLCERAIAAKPDNAAAHLALSQLPGPSRRASIRPGRRGGQAQEVAGARGAPADRRQSTR
jgi:hypothetical protein